MIHGLSRVDCRARHELTSDVTAVFALESFRNMSDLGPLAEAGERWPTDKRRRPDSNRGITDLQSAALPLGYGARTRGMLTFLGHLRQSRIECENAAGRAGSA